MSQGRFESSAFFKEALFDQRTTLVKEIVAQENAEFDKKTANLRALRFAKQREEISQKKVSR